MLRRCGDKLIQATEPATQKPRSPNFVLVLGLSKRIFKNIPRYTQKANLNSSKPVGVKKRCKNPQKRNVNQQSSVSTADILNIFIHHHTVIAQ